MNKLKRFSEEFKNKEEAADFCRRNSLLIGHDGKAGDKFQSPSEWQGGTKKCTTFPVWFDCESKDEVIKEKSRSWFRKNAIGDAYEWEDLQKDFEKMSDEEFQGKN